MDSVPSDRTCPANLGVLSCPVRKLTSPVQSSPMIKKMAKKLRAFIVSCVTNRES